MKLGKIQSNIAFRRALTQSEMTEYKEVLAKAREIANGGGKSIFIVHDSCLPQVSQSDIGVGHLTSKTSGEFFDYIKNYMGINTVEVLPQGEAQLRHTPNFYNTYNGSALSLGSQEIDLELLTQPKFHSILPAEDFQSVVEANKKTAQEGLVNFENILGAESNHEKALRKAFDNFKNDKSISKKSFAQYKKTNADWLEKKAIYEVLKRTKENSGKEWPQWKSEIDRTLFDSTDAKHLKRIAQIKANTKNAYEIEFQMFKQFLADEHLKLGRENLNSKDMKLFGDCLIGFSQDEVWGNKKAFLPDTFVGDKSWKLPSLNYETILDPKSEAQKLLKRKVELFAKRYDGIRFDCSWCYVEPKVSNGKKYNFEGKLLDIIENTVKKVKGEKFVPTDLIHEFEAGPEDFSILDPAKRLKPALKNRVKIISSAYLNKEYGSAARMAELEIPVDDFVIGVGNHDPQPLRQIAQNIPEKTKGKLSYKRKGQAELLSKILNLNSKEMTTAADFSKAKFAEPLMAKNQMVFYMDAFGRLERFDAQDLNSRINYRYRIPTNYAKQYEKAVQEGFGYSPMDAYAKVFKAKGLDRAEPSLYSKILKFRDIISDKAEIAVKTVKSKSKEISKNKMLNIGAVVVALGLIGLVISKTKSSLDDIK